MRPLAACTILATLGLSAAEPVLVIHSYGQGYGWTDSIQAGIEKTLKGKDVALKTIYLDTKKVTDPEARKKAAAAAKEELAAFKPKVVITSDDLAQSLLAKDYLGVAGAPVFVFNGVNAEPAKYGYDQPANTNITGVLERAHWTQAVDLLLKVAPATKKIAVISDPGEVMQAVYDFCKPQKVPVEVASWDVAETFADWQRLIQGYNGTVDAVVIHNYQQLRLKAGEEAKADPKEVMAWTVASLKKPSVGIYDFAVKDGVLCGIAESGEEHGEISAAMALAVLTGKTLPKITTAGKGLVMFNVVTAKQMGADIPLELLESADLIVGK